MSRGAGGGSSRGEVGEEGEEISGSVVKSGSSFLGGNVTAK